MLSKIIKGNFLTFLTDCSACVTCIRGHREGTCLFTLGRGYACDGCILAERPREFPVMVNGSVHFTTMPTVTILK